MLEKSAAAVQTAPVRPPVRAGKTESVTERIERLSEAISRRAFELYEQEGRIDGHDVRHWLEAEKEFLYPVRVNMEETEGEFVVRAEVPGFTASDLEVNVEPRRVTIAGKRQSKQETKQGETLCAEESSDEIFRAIDLPSEVVAIKVSATLKDGILNIQIPQAESKGRGSAESQPA